MICSTSTIRSAPGPCGGIRWRPASPMRSNTGSSTGSSISTPAINLNSNSNNNNQNNITSFNANGVSIIADGAQNALVVKAEPQLMREIEAAIQQLDVRRQQVLIEATIIEVSGNDADQLGVQWALGDLSSGVGLINFDNVGSSLSKLAAGYLVGGAAGLGSAMGTGTSLILGDYKEGADGSRKLYGALIQALKSNTKSNLLSTPSILTMDNEEAYIVVGENVPFVTGSVTTNGGTANPYTSIERKDVGVTLKVIPHIGEGGSIRLEVEQEVSAVADSKGQASDLVTSKRAIKTSVLADHGQTIVLGGLISDDVSQSRQSVPLLGDIPGLGRLFRSDGKSSIKRNLLVFIHPTIVGDSKDVRKLAQERYSQLYSLQLAMDTEGNFAKLPENVEDINQQRLPLTSPVNSTLKEMQPENIQPKNYQQVPSGGVSSADTQSSVVITPVAIEPAIQRTESRTETERTKNTVTTTTVRPTS